MNKNKRAKASSKFKAESKPLEANTQGAQGKCGGITVFLEAHIKHNKLFIWTHKEGEVNKAQVKPMKVGQTIRGKRAKGGSEKQE